MVTLAEVRVILKAQPMARILHLGPRYFCFRQNNWCYRDLRTTQLVWKKIHTLFFHPPGTRYEHNCIRSRQSRISSVLNSSKNPKAYRVCRQVKVKRRFSNPKGNKSTRAKAKSKSKKLEAKRTNQHRQTGKNEHRAWRRESAAHRLKDKT